MIWLVVLGIAAVNGVVVPWWAWTLVALRWLVTVVDELLDLLLKEAVR